MRARRRSCCTIRWRPSLSIWDELTAALEPAYRVIRLDARGHGESEAPPGPYDMRSLGRDVVGLMDHLGIEKTRYLGLSMGGFVGQILGIEHPQRFHSLVLVSTSSDMSPARARFGRRASRPSPRTACRSRRRGLDAALAVAGCLEEQAAARRPARQDGGRYAAGRVHRLVPGDP